MTSENVFSKYTMALDKIETTYGGLSNSPIVWVKKRCPKCFNKELVRATESYHALWRCDECGLMAHWREFIHTLNVPEGFIGVSDGVNEFEENLRFSQGLMNKGVLKEGSVGFRVYG